ncbi:hypothetical protein N7495_005831 [Penicillium taxi]|uniref:uncharacterized protein n=1 Tax=Penicillium taxi TaxID=168475 RepID=UPI002545BCAA|nr:uncharacterized protein N7495_005831 [Penicillium taxi]KAJ5894140.1 hypothetical protein N7495_005831 [Penicillium taxi]
MRTVNPLFIENSGAYYQHTPFAIENFNPQYLEPLPTKKLQDQQTTFAPSALVTCDPNLVDLDDSRDTSYGFAKASSIYDMTTLTESPPLSPGGMAHVKGEKVTIGASTAMAENKDEVPITYLNKGQVYALSIVDSNQAASTEVLRYRTFVHISFDKEPQRVRPEYAWELWKDGRGSSEAHQHGGKLLALELVNLDAKNYGTGSIQVEKSFFDGFCITWSSNPTIGTSGCHLSVRFNFLSTDFTHSKGVKGIPLRLCAKTQLLPSENFGVLREAELCYCQIQLFRDHGAERKLSNDVTRLRKRIEKLSTKMEKPQMTGSKKRKRSNITSTRGNSLKQPQGPFDTLSSEDELTSKMAVLKDEVFSSHSISVFALRCDEQDDPDLSPVRILTESDLRDMGNLTLYKEDDLGKKSSSITSLSSEASTKSERATSRELPEKTHKREVLDIDPRYRPPTERSLKSVACFYVQFADSDQTQQCYRALYLTARSVSDLLMKISEKSKINPALVVRILHATESGLQVTVDDKVIHGLPDGQTMVVEVKKCPTATDSSQDMEQLEIILKY